MEKIAIHLTEVLMLIVLLFGTSKYWTWKLRKGYNIENKNISYSIFVSLQFLTMAMMTFLSADAQNSSYIESLSLIGNGAGECWSYIGVNIFGLVFLMMIANIVGHLMYAITMKAELSFYEEIMENNIAPVILCGILILLLGTALSIYILKPYLLGWISTNSNMIPLI